MSAARFYLVWRHTIELLRSQDDFRFDLIDLEKMPECVGEQRNPFLDLHVSAHPSGAYVANLGDDWEALYGAKRSASTRKRERRQLRQLAQHGDVRFVELQGGCEEDSERTRRFVEMFVRPRGLDRPAAPILADEVERLAAAGATPPRPGG